MVQALKKQNSTYFELGHSTTQKEIRLQGSWNVRNIQSIYDALERANLFKKSPTPLTLNCTQLDDIDSAGAFVLLKLKQAQLGNITDIKPSFLELITRFEQLKKTPPTPHEPTSFVQTQLIELGKNVQNLYLDSLSLFSFFGQSLILLSASLIRPAHIRWTSLFHHMKKMGFDALPIIGLLTFLVGIVIAYQGAGQLQKFGADIFTVNLVGIGTLRELGILLTAVILAGRTGSSITAQIGTMSVNEEIDALKTMGVDPLEILVIPRILALILILPLLTFFADIMALFGGMIGCYLLLGINAQQFIAQLHEAVPVMAFWVGLMKAPVFAFIIGLVGCYEGFKVHGSAESVGLHTTASVVKSIFIIIIFDAIFSILLVYFDI